MDDIHLEDPRKFSAKQIKEAGEKALKRRSVWQYLFDLIIKTLICATIIAIDFTLFANAGSYNLFSSSIRLNVEAEYIYLAIAVFSFCIMLVASFWRSLENLVLSLCFALFSVAIINQFATFEKQSGLLILFGNVFSDSANAVLYEYSFWIIAGVAFILFWILMRLLSRQYLLYFSLALAAVLGWILSEAYLNMSSQYFRNVAGAPTLRAETPGNIFVFLSFNDLTSPNNLLNMHKNNKRTAVVKKSLDNVLGFYEHNKFALYPNALVKDAYDPFANLTVSFNPDSDKNASEHIAVSAIRDDYFNFTALQKDKLYLKNSSLYEMLKKDDYTINVFQSGNVDVCHLNNKLVTAACKEKVNQPIALNDNNFSISDKVVLLMAQWLNSTGLVSSINPLLKVSEYILPSGILQPLGVEADKLSILNSFKVFDQIIESIDKQNGNQAYFAIIDFPSSAYVYDEFCRLKDIKNWKSADSIAFVSTSIEGKRDAYADQLNCLYGYLEKFMQMLDKSGQLDKTTIVIEGLNTPQGLNKPASDYYRGIQGKEQVMLAIRPADAANFQTDYSVCYVNEILNSYFFTHKPCTEFSGIKTTDKALAMVKEQIEADKFKPETITAAKKSFKEWFIGWTAHNQFESNFKSEDKNVKEEDEKLPDVQTESMNLSDDNLQNVIEEKELIKPVIAEVEVQDVPEEKLKSISVAAEETVADAAEGFAKTPEHELKDEEILSEPQDLHNSAEFDVKALKNNMPVSDSETKTETNLTAKQETQPQPSDILKNDENTAKNQNIENVAGEDVVPETIFDIPEEKKQAEDVIARAKQIVKDKATQKKAAEKAKYISEDSLRLEQSIETISQNDKLKGVLEAPVAAGSKLSPEELKKQYHQVINETAENADAQINIEVNVIEKQ